MRARAALTDNASADKRSMLSACSDLDEPQASVAPIEQEQAVKTGNNLSEQNKKNLSGK